MYERKTRDEYEIQQWTGQHYGWECVTTEDTYRDAKAQRQVSLENQPTYPVRIVKRRVKIVPLR